VIRILFICHGNICRSVAAEMVLKQMIREVLSIVLRKFLLNRLDCLRPGRASAVKGACTRLALDGR